MITTTCKALNWMISKAAEYDKSDEHTVYHFRGNVPSRMRHEINDWMKEQGAHRNDGRTRSGYGLQIEERIDAGRRWYNMTSVSVSFGCYHSTANNAEMFLTIYDCHISDEDWKEMEVARAA